MRDSINTDIIKDKSYVSPNTNEWDAFLTQKTKARAAQTDRHKNTVLYDE